MRPFLSAMLLVFATCAQAYHFIDETEPDRPTVEDGTPWKEGKVRLPPYPARDDLMPLSLDDRRGYRYYLDKTHLRVDPDQVVRYTLVIEPRPGLWNVSYEGIRCNAWSYKLYGYGDGRGRMRALPKGDWLPLRTGSPAYQRQLHDLYFCREGSYTPYSREEILYRLRSNTPTVDRSLLP